MKTIGLTFPEKKPIAKPPKEKPENEKAKDEKPGEKTEKPEE